MVDLGIREIIRSSPPSGIREERPERAVNSSLIFYPSLAGLRKAQVMRIARLTAAEEACLLGNKGRCCRSRRRVTFDSGLDLSGEVWRI